MASNSSSMALFVVFNLLFFTFTTACHSPPKSSSTPTPIPVRPNPRAPPSPPASPTPSTTGKCPIDTLKLGVCVNVLNGLINAVIGTPPKQPCCALIEGLADLEAAICLCTVIKASVLGINLNIPLSLSLLVNYCGKNVPSGFQCP